MSDIPTPVTRNEQFLNAIANGDPSDLPTPVTREEQYLDYIAKNGGGGGGAGVSSFNGRTGAVVPKSGDYTAEQVGALPDNTFIPSNISDLNNDSGFVGLGETASTAYAGDKGKANASAIKAIENVTGAKNVFPGWSVESATRLMAEHAVAQATAYTVTFDAPGKSLQYRLYYHFLDGTSAEVTSGWTSFVNNTSFTTSSTTVRVGYRLRISDDSAISVNDIVNTMVRPVGTDSTYVPYAMTNAELTEKVTDVSSQLGNAEIYSASSNGNTSVTFSSVKIKNYRYPALFIGNGNGTPYMAVCALHSANVSDVGISDPNLTIATSNVTDTTYDLTISGVDKWGFYALMVFYY